MQEKIEEIRKQAEERIKEIRNSQELQELKVKVLGKKSELSNLLKGIISFKRYIFKSTKFKVLS